MRDVHNLKGKKIYVELIDEFTLINKVREVYPEALRTGTNGSCSFRLPNPDRSGYNDGELVAEAWIHATRPGWWLRIKPKKCHEC